MLKKALTVIACSAIVSLPLGAAWTTKRITNNAGDSIHIGTAVSGQNVYVAWADSTPGLYYQIFFRKSADGGATWQAATQLTNCAEDCFLPAIAASGQNIYVVWVRNRAGNYEIYLMKSADGGATWQTAKRLTNTAGSSNYPCIALSDTHVYVAWNDDTPGVNEIYFKRSIDGGATWQKAKRLTYTTGDSEQPAMAISGSNVYLVWHDNATDQFEVYFRKSPDGGATWQAAKNVSMNTGDSQRPGLAVSNANIYLVWQDDTTGNYKIYFRKSADGGASWQATRFLTSTTMTSENPEIAVSGTKVYAVWADAAPGNYEIYLRRSPDGGATWQAAQRLTNNAGNSEGPAVVIGNANIYVGWHDRSSGNYEIYLKYSPL